MILLNKYISLYISVDSNRVCPDEFIFKYKKINYSCTRRGWCISGRYFNDCEKIINKNGRLFSLTMENLNNDDGDYMYDKTRSDATLVLYNGLSCHGTLYFIFNIDGYLTPSDHIRKYRLFLDMLAH